MKRLAAAAACALLASCVMVPRTVHGWDPECRVTVRRMELQPVQLASIQHCHNEGCLVLLAAAGATAAASTIVSGSITIVGNVVYWLEERGNCKPAS